MLTLKINNENSSKKNEHKFIQQKGKKNEITDKSKSPEVLPFSSDE